MDALTGVSPSKGRIPWRVTHDTMDPAGQSAIPPGGLRYRYDGIRLTPRPRMNGSQQALEQACAAAGLDADDARLLRLGSNAVYRLKTPVVARISRDAVRARLRIGTDRASALVAAVRAEAAAGTGSQPLRQAA